MTDTTATPSGAAGAETAAPETPAPEAKDGKKKPEKVNWVAEIRGLAIMLLAVLGFHSLLAKPFYIPSGSMIPNLLVGDRLVVSKYPYGWSWVSASFHLLPRSDWKVASKLPQYGDIVIAVPPDRPEDYIKRVIGLPGDRVAIVNSKVRLNGKFLPREAIPAVQVPVDVNSPCVQDAGATFVRLPSGKEVCELEAYRETLPNGATYTIADDPDAGDFDNTPEVTVPDGYVFLMGDNRDHSADSRAPSALDIPGGNGLGGPVPLSSVGGRAEFTTFSLDGTMSWNPLTWWGAFRSGRAWTSLRPTIVESGGKDGAAK